MLGFIVTMRAVKLLNYMEKYNLASQIIIYFHFSSLMFKK
jgi:hypothetical protein